MKLNIEKFDQLGNGIGYYEGKVVFVGKTMPGDVVDVKIVKETKNYIISKVDNIVSLCSQRIKSNCPFFEICGGCDLQMLTYENTIDYKKKRVEEILNSFNISIINIVENIEPWNYRNNISLKIKDGKIGYYEKNSHLLVEIDECKLAKKSINSVLEIIKSFNINNGNVTIRANYNDEILVVINTKDKVLFDKKELIDKKIVGIVLNDECIYGEKCFIEKIKDLFFEVSYNSFFQVNNYICSKLFEIITNEVNGDTILDLYSGVGTLSIVASKKCKKVYAIEIIENAVINALKNAKMNKCDNISFILGKVEDKISLIKDSIDTLIVDPPRSGLDQQTLNVISKLKPKKIIYISCDTQSLKNNLEFLTNNKYEIQNIYLLDMFSYTYHVECICVLNIR